MYFMVWGWVSKDSKVLWLLGRSVDCCRRVNLFKHLNSSRNLFSSHTSLKALGQHLKYSNKAAKHYIQRGKLGGVV